MDAVPILLADAITTAINAAVSADAFETAGFTAERAYPDWDDDFTGLKDLAVNVVPVTSSGDGGELVELDTEGSANTDPAVDVVVRKRFNNSDRQTPGAATGRLKPTSVDPLLRLVEQIHEEMASDRGTAIELATGIYANWIDASIRTYCDYGRLREGNFLGVVRLKYNVSKTM